MISKNLARRLERLEDSLLPALEEPLVLRIISVSPNGERVDSGIGVQNPRSPEAVQEEALVKAIVRSLLRLREKRNRRRIDVGSRHRE
jgi:hypothetical protein